MGSDDNYALKWNDFHSNISSLFKHLRVAPEFQASKDFCRGFGRKYLTFYLVGCQPSLWTRGRGNQSSQGNHINY